MNTDFRLSIGLTSNPKTIKLMRRCGDRAFFCLIQLWGWVAQYRPEGNLVGMDTEAIEIAAGWTGLEGQFVEQLAAIGFLDGEDGAYSLHDWEEHNPWAAGANARSEAASKAGKASAAKRAGNRPENPTDSNGDATDVERAFPTDSNGDATDVERAFPTDSNGDATPSPSPSPSPSPKEEKHIVGQECPTPCVEGQITPEKPDPVPYAKIIGVLNETCGCQFKADTQATRRHIKARWNEGWRLTDFEAVITSRHAEWGGDAKMLQYLRPETLFGTKFESYLQQARNGPQAGVGTVDGSTAPANQDELVRRIKEERAERDRKLRGQNAATAAA